MARDNEKSTFIAVIVLFAAIAVIIWAVWEPAPPLPPPEPYKLPTAEQVGKAAGKTSRNFGKGFIEGFRNPE